MSDEEKAKKYLEARGLGDVARVSDPDQTLYRSFELRRARLAEIINPSVLRRGFHAARRGFVNGVVPQGDGLRMGGSFLIHRGEVVRAFRNADVADRPDYCEIARL
jgi:hypothetical protein